MVFPRSFISLFASTVFFLRIQKKVLEEVKNSINLAKCLLVRIVIERLNIFRTSHVIKLVERKDLSFYNFFKTIAVGSLAVNIKTKTAIFLRIGITWKFPSRILHYITRVICLLLRFQDGCPKFPDRNIFAFYLARKTVHQ